MLDPDPTKHQCPECPSEFTKKQDLEAHMKWQRNPTECACNECNNYFKTVSSFNRHQSSYHPQNPLNEKCIQCKGTKKENKTYPSQFVLDQHIASAHNDEST